jgi:hypothetical protein
MLPGQLPIGLRTYRSQIRQAVATYQRVCFLVEFAKQAHLRVTDSKSVEYKRKDMKLAEVSALLSLGRKMPSHDFVPPTRSNAVKTVKAPWHMQFACNGASCG